MSEGESNPGFVPEEVDSITCGNSDQVLSEQCKQSPNLDLHPIKIGHHDDKQIDKQIDQIESITGEKVTKIKPNKWNISFSRRQWTFLLIFGVTNVFRAVSILISPPFYPPEAKDRGISDTEIGFVFGSYDFSTFCVVLLFGKLIIPRYGPRLVFKLSVLNLALCTFLFGCLDFTQDRRIFLTFSFLIRIVAGAGDAGFYPSAFTIFAQEFEGNVSTAIGLFELLFGFGAIFGPIVFGSFIDYAGFLAVYAIVGFLIFCCVLMTHFFIPGPTYFGNPNDSSEIELGAENPVHVSSIDIKSSIPDPVGATKSTKKWFHLFLIPTILVIILNLFTTAVSIGFLSATLESHLEQFHLTTFQTSAVFIVSNAIYTLTTPAWGKISDHLKNGWRFAVIFFGTGLILVGFCWLGPLPFLASNSKLWTTLIGLTLHGLGIGGAVMSGFPYAADAALAEGYPETEDTFSLISSVYIMTFTLGNAVGPSVSGLLVDTVEFQNATFFVVGLSILVLLSALVLALIQRGRKKQK